MSVIQFSSPSFSSSKVASKSSVVFVVSSLLLRWIFSITLVTRFEGYPFVSMNAFFHMDQFLVQRFLCRADLVSSSDDPREGSYFLLFRSVGFPLNIDVVACRFSLDTCLQLAIFFSFQEYIQECNLFFFFDFVCELDVWVKVVENRYNISFLLPILTKENVSST